MPAVNSWLITSELITAFFQNSTRQGEEKCSALVANSL